MPTSSPRSSACATGRPAIRVSAMLAARDSALVDSWLPRGPDRDDSRMLVTRSVKAFYDGAMGSRGAFFLTTTATGRASMASVARSTASIAGAWPT